MKFFKLIGCIILATLVGMFMLLTEIAASPFFAFRDYVTNNLIPSYKDIINDYKGT